MNNPKLTHDSSELVLRQNAQRLTWIAIIPTIGLSVIGYHYREIMISMTKHPIPGTFLLGILSFTAIYMWIKIFDKGIKMVINKEGIWSKKYGLIPWSNIFSYKIETSYWGAPVRISQSLLKLDTQNPGRLISLEVTFFGDNMYKIASAIKSNSIGYDVQKL